MSNELNKSLFRKLNTQPVCFNPIYSTLCGSIKVSNLNKKEYLEKNQSAGILLSQLLYWYSAMKEIEFYKPNEELIEECGSSEYSHRQNIKRLVELGFIKYSLKKIIRIGKDKKQFKSQEVYSHWLINEETIIKAINELENTEMLNSTNPGDVELNGSQGDVELNRSYNKTEITTEINKKILKKENLEELRKINIESIQEYSQTLTDKPKETEIEWKSSNAKLKDMIYDHQVATKLITETTETITKWLSKQPINKLSDEPNPKSRFNYFFEKHIPKCFNYPPKLSYNQQNKKQFTTETDHDYTGVILDKAPF